MDGLYQEGDYLKEKRRLELELESLVVPEVNAAGDAGKLLQDLPRLWELSTLAERRSLLMAMLEAVYVDHKEDKAVVAIQPKPAFRAVFQVATTRAGSGVVLIKEPPDQTQINPFRLNQNIKPTALQHQGFPARHVQGFRPVAPRSPAALFCP